MNLLVTGGAGFIGSNFVHYIKEKYPKYRIVVLDALTYAGSVENLPQEFSMIPMGGYEFVYGNVTNGALVDTLVSRVDAVVHFAAETHVTRSIYDNTAFFTTDIIGTQTLANAVCKYSKTVDRFIHISSSEVYGTALTEKMSEDHPLNPASPYAAAKAGADRLVFSYWNTYKIPAITMRPFNNYGPRQHLEKVLPRFITSTMLGESIRVHGNGAAARDFIYVQDTCDALDALLHADKKLVCGEAFNVGSGVDRSITELASAVFQRLGSAKKQYVGDRPGQVVRHTADITKIAHVLNWTPKVTWEVGLEETINWYKNNKNIWAKQLWAREIPIITAAGSKELH